MGTLLAKPGGNGGPILLLNVAMMSTGRDPGLSGCRIYVVEDSLGAICLSRLCPQFRCQPKVKVLADDSFRREASSLIGRLTFGRCTVAVGYNGGNRLHVGLHLIDVMLDPAEGYGIKYEGSFLEKSQSGCVQNFCHFVCLHHFWA